MKKYTTYILATLIMAIGVASVHAQKKVESDAQSMEQLLDYIRQGVDRDQKDLQQREDRFRRNQRERNRLTQTAKRERNKESARSTRLERLVESNKIKIDNKKKQLEETLGGLTELFGHLIASAGDLRGGFETSIIGVHFPDRIPFLTALIEKASTGENLPSIKDFEQLWLIMNREMVESGKVVKFQSQVSNPAGEIESRNVVRIGSFNIVDEDGNYLSYREGKLGELPRQPSGGYLSWAEDLAVADDGYHPIGVDPTGPTGGTFLSALIDSPTLIERWQQGGIIGYIITGVGVFAVLLALWRLLALFGVAGRVSWQLKNTDNPNKNNPLGRVFAVASGEQNLEALEIKVTEAVLKEVPKLESGQALLKIIAGIAPLMGLLGTVTGMILTFQGIVIFGAGDPKAMAGGISQALVTTVLGLLVAIPTVLLHTLVSGRSKKIIQILEEQSTGLIATRM